MNGYSNIGHGGRNITLFEGHTGNATVSKFMGKHSVKFGVDYRRLSGYAEAPNNASFGFTQAFTQGPNPNTASSVAGDAFASFLLGYPATGDVNVATPGTYYTDYYSAFMQDDFRITSKLSLNFGIRWDYGSPITEVNNYMANLDIAPAYAAIALVKPGETGPYSGSLPRSLVRVEKIPRDAVGKVSRARLLELARGQSGVE